MRFYPLEKLINLHNDYKKHFRIDHHQLLLMQRDGELFLVEATCPHRSHPLGASTVTDGTIECPLHAYRFSLSTGELLHATEERCRPLRVYDLVYEGNQVGVLLPP